MKLALPAAGKLQLTATTRQGCSAAEPASIRAVCYRLFTLGLLDAMTKAEIEPTTGHGLGSTRW